MFRAASAFCICLLLSGHSLANEPDPAPRAFVTGVYQMKINGRFVQRCLLEPPAAAEDRMEMERLGDCSRMQIAEAEKAARATAKFAKKFEPLRRTILDPTGTFNASRMIADLWALEAVAMRIGQQSPEMSRLYSMLSLVEAKRGNHVDQLVLGERSLDIHAMNRALTDEEVFYLHHDLLAAAEKLKLPDNAVVHARGAVEWMDRVTSLDQLQRFGLRESLGYWLHEAGQFEAAKANNQALLADAERALGSHDGALSGVLNNLAQNSYKLGELEAAGQYLSRCLEIAHLHKRVEREFDVLFQLGVLAQEQGDSERARRHFQQRLELAEREHDEDLYMQAVATLDELQSRAQADKNDRGSP
ncbi:hypothetical protein GCM10011488_52190 [Steroidobacter agaridevorans]|nr:hypothetical protein GCM10011488_52190 [Steroidobacter agaridevorans]